MSNQRLKALDYHQHPKPGKIEIKAAKVFKTVNDLSLAYTPGIAEPVCEIAKKVQNAFCYTNKGNQGQSRAIKGNLVAVITDGSAVLGLDDVGALAGKPVMEGKAMLFKHFSDIDAFDIEIDAPSTEAFIETVVNIAPTFGGINLEDVAAPKCFTVEQSIRERVDYPNQVNNALVFPFLFRAAVDVHATQINDAMMMVVVHGIAELAKQPVPAEVIQVYQLKSLEYGNDYFIPAQFDPRLEECLVPQAAIDSGVARINNENDK